MKRNKVMAFREWVLNEQSIPLKISPARAKSALDKAMGGTGTLASFGFGGNPDYKYLKNLSTYKEIAMVILQGMCFTGGTGMRSAICNDREKMVEAVFMSFIGRPELYRNVEKTLNDIIGYNNKSLLDIIDNFITVDPSTPYCIDEYDGAMTMQEVYDKIKDKI